MSTMYNLYYHTKKYFLRWVENRPLIWILESGWQILKIQAKCKKPSIGGQAEQVEKTCFLNVSPPSLDCLCVHCCSVLLIWLKFLPSPVLYCLYCVYYFCSYIERVQVLIPSPRPLIAIQGDKRLKLHPPSLWLGYPAQEQGHWHYWKSEESQLI